MKIKLVATFLTWYKEAKENADSNSRSKFADGTFELLDADWRRVEKPGNFLNGMVFIPVKHSINGEGQEMLNEMKKIARKAGVKLLVGSKGEGYDINPDILWSRTAKKGSEYTELKGKVKEVAPKAEELEQVTADEEI
jgi:hypothetical protein